MPDQSRPRRSALYMPGSKPRALEKARGLAADVLILDLEDAVIPAEKAGARDAVAEAVRARAYGRREVVIRINGLDTPWGADDLAAAAECRPDAILVPKVEAASALGDVEMRLERAGAGDIAALGDDRDAARRAACRRDRALLALARLPGDGHERPRRRAPRRPDARPRAAGDRRSPSASSPRARTGSPSSTACTTPSTTSRGCAPSAVQGREMGFDGKTLIHPGQLDIANEVFAPSADEVDTAPRHLAAFAEAEAAGQGVAVVDGRIVENLHVESARRCWRAPRRSGRWRPNSHDPALILGLLLWWVTHLEKIMAPGPRAAAVGRMGEGPWKGSIAVDARSPSRDGDRLPARRRRSRSGRPPLLALAPQQRC